MRKLTAVLSATALCAAGLAFTVSGPAQATNGGSEDCVETQDGYTAWTKTGYTEVQHGGTPAAPGENTATKEYRGPVTWQHKTKDAVEGTEDQQVLVTPAIPAVAAVWANFQPNDQQATFVGPAIYPDDERGSWNVHNQVPGGHADEPDGVYAKGNPDKGGNWFYKQSAKPEVPAVYETIEGTPGSPAEYETDWKYKVYERTFVPGNDCPDPEDPKPWICHPVNGKGELGNGWNLIKPDQASIHIDEETGEPKHVSKDGRVDTLATYDGVGDPDDEDSYSCPGDEVEEDASAVLSTVQRATCDTPASVTLTLVNAVLGQNAGPITFTGPQDAETVSVDALAGHVFAGDLDALSVDIPALAGVLDSPSAECPVSTPIPAVVDGIDACGTDNDVAPSLDPAEGPFSVVDTGSAFELTPDEGYYFDGVEGVLSLPYTANTDEPCPTDQPDPTVDKTSSSSYECGDDFATVETTTTVTEFVSNDGGVTWVEGEPVSTTVTKQVDHEVVACPVDDPKDPPKEPKNVPTSVDAGLGGPTNSAGNGASNGLLGGGFVALLGLAMVGLAARKRLTA